jgi:hypothetical protein
MSTKAHEPASPPLDRVPTLSTDSSQILNDILRANSHSAPVQILDKRTGPRRSGRVHNRNELQREALGCATVDEEEQKPGDRATTQSKVLPGASEKEYIRQVQSHTSPLPQTSSRIVSQELVVKTSRTGSAMDPLVITMSQQLKLEDSAAGGPCSDQQKLSTSEPPSVSLTIQDFVARMAGNLEHPSATMFSYPIDCMESLGDCVRNHGLCMHILSLPDSEEKWVPVVIGRDTNAVTKLLEDGEKLARGLRRPDTSKVREFDLGLSHVVVGALGALATWAGLAYS